MKKWCVVLLAAALLMTASACSNTKDSSADSAKSTSVHAAGSASEDAAESVSVDAAESASEDAAESVSADTAESVSVDAAESASEDTAVSASEDTAVSASEDTAVSASEDTAVSVSEETAEKKEEKFILDDEAATVQFAGVFEISPDKKDMETEEPAVGIIFSVTNHGEKELVMDLRNLRIGKRPVVRVLLEGDIVSPGTTIEYRYGIMADTKNASDPKTEPPVMLKDVLTEGISGDIHLVNMEGEAGQAAFSLSGNEISQL